jgi:hypothetical protein
MRWTWLVGVAAGVLALSGCVYVYESAGMRPRYGYYDRPEPSYYCYDCHGYRYFDPYYDWCVRHGFRYAWVDHPQVIEVYRARYVRIKEQHPDYGRYRYRAGYREEPRYREPLDYDRWTREGRVGEGKSGRARGEEMRDERRSSRPDRNADLREKERVDQGNKKRDKALEKERKKELQKERKQERSREREKREEGVRRPPPDKGEQR